MALHVTLTPCMYWKITISCRVISIELMHLTDAKERWDKLLLPWPPAFSPTYIHEHIYEQKCIACSERTPNITSQDYKTFTSLAKPCLTSSFLYFIYLIYLSHRASLGHPWCIELMELKCTLNFLFFNILIFVKVNSQNIIRLSVKDQNEFMLKMMIYR